MTMKHSKIHSFDPEKTAADLPQDLFNHAARNPRFSSSVEIPHPEFDAVTAKISSTALHFSVGRKTAAEFNLRQDAHDLWDLYHREVDRFFRGHGLGKLGFILIERMVAVHAQRHLFLDVVEHNTRTAYSDEPQVIQADVLELALHRGFEPMNVSSAILIDRIRKKIGFEILDLETGLKAIPDETEPLALLLSKQLP
jgi:hypothetical protein